MTRERLLKRRLLDHDQRRSAEGGGIAADGQDARSGEMVWQDVGRATLLAVLTALTIVLGMRLMGAMLISSLVIFPALSAMRVRKSFRGVVILAGILSVTCFCAGLTASYLLSTPVGATVVIADLLAFLVCSIVGKK